MCQHSEIPVKMTTVVGIASGAICVAAGKCLYVNREESCMTNQYILFNILNPTGHVMHQQFNIQQLYVLPTLYLCVLYLSENKQRLVTLTA